VSSHAKGNVHNAYSGPPVGCGGGEGDPARARAWRRVGCRGRSVPAEQMWLLFPYSPECVGGRLAEKCSPFFLSLGPSSAGSLVGLQALFMG
jgi:hypothetical protein